MTRCDVCKKEFEQMRPVDEYLKELRKDSRIYGVVVHQIADALESAFEPDGLKRPDVTKGNICKCCETMIKSYMFEFFNDLYNPLTDKIITLFPEGSVERNNKIAELNKILGEAHGNLAKTHKEVGTAYEELRDSYEQLGKAYESLKDEKE